MVFDFKKITDFAMDIDKLNLNNLVGKVIDKDHGLPNFYATVYKKIHNRDLQKIKWGFAENHKTSPASKFIKPFSKPNFKAKI